MDGTWRGGRGLLLSALLVVAACGGVKTPGAGPGGGSAGAGSAGTPAPASAGGDGGAGSPAGGPAGDPGAPGGGGDPGAAGAAAAAGAPGAAGAADDGGAGAADDGASAAPDDGGDASPADGGTRLPPYDKGIVDVVNADNWNETTIHPFSKRRMLLRDEGDPHLVLVDFGAPNAIAWKTVAGGGPWGRGIQLIGNNQVMGGRNDGYEVFDLATGSIVKTVRTFANTQSAYRMANGETMLTQGGAASAADGGEIKLSFLDQADHVSHTITYPGFGYVRMVRPTREKTFLVPADTKLFEGDADGHVLWTASGPTWAHVWEPLLAADGNVVLATFFGSSLDIVDRSTHMVTKRYGTKTMPMAQIFRPNAFAEFQILPNGNLITTNWQGHGGGNGGVGIQVIEFNPAGDVVWYYKQDPTAFAAIQGILVLDGLDPRFLHAQEISPDSTWQPVIPTP
jgi:hypothetical protein